MAPYKIPRSFYLLSESGMTKESEDALAELRSSFPSFRFQQVPTGDYLIKNAMGKVNKKKMKMLVESEQLDIDT